MDRVDDFYNELLLAFAMPDRMFWRKLAKSKHTARNVAVVRNGLMKADRFFVSDELVEEAVKMSFMPPHKILELVGFARPCMHNMWIEWNERVRIRAVHKHLSSLNLDKPIEPLDEENEADKVGYHIWRLEEFYGLMGAHEASTKRKLEYTPHAENSYVYFNYTKQPNGKVIMPVHAWYLSIDEIDTDELLASNTYVGADGKFIRSPDKATNELHEKTRELCAYYGFGQTYWGINDSRRTEKVRDSLKKQMSMSYHELTYSFYTPDEVSGTNQNKYFNASSLSMDGDLRFMVCLNAMINYPHFVIQKESPKVYQQRMIHGRRMPRNELNVLELELPKPRGVTWYTKKFSNVGSPKRRHKRRGHDRYIKLKDGTIVRKWIEEQWVGNEELGTIFHEYDLKRSNDG